MTTRLAGTALIASMFCLTAMPDVAADSKAAPLPTQGGKVPDLAGSRLYYEECGSGSSIVLLHDGLLHGVTWDGVWDALCAKYHVVRYDRRGYGRSDPPTAPFSPTEDLFQLLSRLSLPHALVVGSSSGGALAVDFALEHPGMVDGLFLIGPVLHGMQDTAYFVARGDKNNEPMKRGDIKATAENWSKDRFLIAGEAPKAGQAPSLVAGLPACAIELEDDGCTLPTLPAGWAD